MTAKNNYKGGKVYYLNLTSVTTLVELIAQHTGCTKSEAIRLIKSGGIRVNQVQCVDAQRIFQYNDEPKEYVIHIGKHDHFILLLDHYQTEPSEGIVLLKWERFMKSTPSLTKEVILNWEFENYGA